MGVGSQNDDVRGKLVYAMKVEDTKTFDEYWHAPEFAVKRPIFTGSLMQAQGDNIYHQSPSQQWIQQRSRHTHSDSAKTLQHTEHDTKTNRVLISRTFVYLGQKAEDIPVDFMDDRGVSLNLDDRNTENGGERREANFNDPILERKFLDWLDSLSRWGCQGDPNEWRKVRSIDQMLRQCY